MAAMNQTIDTVRAVTNFLNWKKKKKKNPWLRSISATTSSSPQPTEWVRLETSAIDLSLPVLLGAALRPLEVF